MAGTIFISIVIVFFIYAFFWIKTVSGLNKLRQAAEKEFPKEVEKIIDPQGLGESHKKKQWYMLLLAMEPKLERLFQTNPSVEELYQAYCTSRKHAIWVFFLMLGCIILIPVIGGFILGLK